MLSRLRRQQLAGELIVTRYAGFGCLCMVNWIRGYG